MSLNDVKTWGYQLQNIKPAKIAGTPYDLVVVDHPRNNQQGEKVRQDIAALGFIAHTARRDLDRV